MNFKDYYLSEKAKKELDSQKNKSEFVRQAIEFYVNARDPCKSNENLSSVDLVEKIRDMIKFEFKELNSMAIEAKGVEVNNTNNINKAVNDEYSEEEKRKLEAQLDNSLIY